METSGTAAPTYKYMVGTLVGYTLDSNGNITNITYGDIVENADGLTVKKIESSCADGKGWTTTEASSVATAEFVDRFDCKDTKERALKLSSGIYLSKDSTGAWVVSSDNSSNAYTAAESKTCKIVFIENHNHLYGTSSAENDRSTFVGNDSNFKLMSFMSNNLMDGTDHYVCCDVCGLEYYPVAHIYDTTTGRTDEQKATCTKCGYYAKNYCEVTVNKSSDPVAMTTADDALEAAKTAWKYGGSTNKFTTATTGTNAAAVMQKVADTLKAADEILKKMGKADGSGARSAIKTLLTVNSEATPGTSIADAIKAASASGSATLDETAVASYKAVLLSAEKALIGIQTDTSSTTVEGITKSETGSVVAEIKYWVNKTSVETDSFVVKKGVILDLDYNGYTTSRGVSYSFAENTGWQISDNEAIQLTAGGFRILGDGTLSFFETL